MKTTESKTSWPPAVVKTFDKLLRHHAPYLDEHAGERASYWPVQKNMADADSLIEWVKINSAKPASSPHGKRIVCLRPVVPARARRAGFAKGTFPYIAPDFDRPLEDFADYQLTQEQVKSSSSQRETAGTPQPRLTGPIMFVRILLSTWNLNQKDAIPLLGLEKSDTSYAKDLLSGRVTLRGRDIKDRIAYLFRIRKTLSALFRDEEVENEWLREPHDALDGQDPMALLIEGSMENLLLVKEYVEAAAGR